MKGPQLKRVSIVIAVCALAGAIAGIAGSAAAPSKSSKDSSSAAQKQALKQRAFRGAFRGGPGPGFGFFGGPVHATAVVPKRDGTGFDTITTDAGTLNSVDGTTVHLKEGTDKATYKDDAAIDVGGDAKVIRNGNDAKLSDLQKGDHVRVITGAPRGNIVIAADDAFIAAQKKRFRGFHHHHGFGHGGPPPGGGPGGYPGDDGGSNQNGSNLGSPGGGTNS